MDKNIVKADHSNVDEWVELSARLFAGHPYEELLEEYRSFLSTEKEVGFLYREDGRTLGFMNLSIRRDYVNGTDSSPVVYLEAVYVLPEFRRHGIARKLTAYAEQYTKEQGYSQLASDCLVENTASEAFHKHCGFQEEERIICFVKNV